MSEGQWIFCQLGAREHYILPRGFSRLGRLRALITDAWVPPGALISRAPGPLGRRFKGRFTPDLPEARVEHFTAAAIAFEIGGRLRRRPAGGWPAIMTRNRWFEQRAVARMRAERLLEGSTPPTVFAYSYAALGILRAAKAAGCFTVLGQIDPAIAEEEIVAQAVRQHASLKPDWLPAPPVYWARWRRECEIADRIVVNSTWAWDGLLAAGIEKSKLSVVPLAYEGNATTARHWDPPVAFTAERPLRVLFLGAQVIRKGIAELLGAAKLLLDEPIEFHLVGQEGVEYPHDAAANAKIIRHGSVPRAAVAAHYAQADVFILPSLSDGFGLTQIEAHANGVPVIASRCCGAVVRDGIDGIVLDAVSAETIVKALRRYLQDPRMLARHAQAATEGLDRFAPEPVVEQLVSETEMTHR